MNVVCCRCRRRAFWFPLVCNCESCTVYVLRARPESICRLRCPNRVANQVDRPTGATAGSHRPNAGKHDDKLLKATVNRWHVNAILIAGHKTTLEFLLHFVVETFDWGRWGAGTPNRSGHRSKMIENKIQYKLSHSDEERDMRWLSNEGKTKRKKTLFHSAWLWLLHCWLAHNLIGKT